MRGRCCAAPRAAEGDVRARGTRPRRPPARRQAVAARTDRHRGRRRPAARARRASSLASPSDFTVHPKLARQLERRTVALDEGGIDWGQAEALAFASLLVEGIPIRLTGQDTERGTFSHRHLVLHDANTGERYTPIQHLDEAARVVRGAQLAAVRVRRGRVRVRLLDRGARGARALGGAVRRLRQRRADHPRPVRRRRALEVERDARASPCSCRTATRATARSTRARGSSASSSSPRRTTSASSTRRPPRSSSTCCAGRRSTRSRARWS